MAKYLRISSYIRKPFLIYDFACNCSILNFLIYEENLIFFFICIGRCYPRVFTGDNASLDVLARYIVLVRL
jgi:hypothetical protein